MLLDVSLNMAKELLESVLQHSGIRSVLPLSSMYPGLPRIESVCKMGFTLLLPVLIEIFLSQARQGAKRNKIAIPVLGRLYSLNHLFDCLFLPAILH